MDLRSIINTEAGDSSVSKQAAPVTPVQAHPLQSFRDYGPQASPGKHPSQDYGAQQGGQYASPTAYRGNYHGRPAPPPVQVPIQNELRSPASSRSYSAQSPYHHSAASAPGQYPFPPTHQTPQSPAQQHQYPSPLQQRDNYSSQQGPQPSLQHQNSYSRASPVPQTPPIGLPGGPRPYLQHQRSQSSISNSTPTSAHSQQPYFNQYQSDSPVSTSHFPPSQLPQHQRQQSLQSQPGTPLGPPLTQRQSSGTFPQPQSPYQQRVLSSGSYSQIQQTSPVPPPPASIPRMPSTPSEYESHRASASEQQRRSQTERERSLSVSPKTRLPSQPPTPLPENGYTNPSKRKMDDRQIPAEEPRRINEEQYDVKPQVNGDHHIPLTPPPQHHRIPSSSPQPPPRKRVRYDKPPIWAQSVRNREVMSKANGKRPGSFPAPDTNGNRQASPAILRQLPPTGDDPDPSILLGPWDKSITGKKPVEQMTKLVADFLYLHVVNRDEMGELASRGVEVEIEAKLGQLIDKDTNQRYYLPVKSECILLDNARVGFKSSMTQMQHKYLNDYLNVKVKETHPQNPQAKGRVEIKYLHRKEIDKFYELPATMHASLPAAVREKLNPRHTVKVRVSHKQDTGEVLAKIIKARITDLDIYMPQSPLDCRISINFEMKYDGDIEGIKAQGIAERIPDRIKDRLSYTQGLYQIDLTQVTQTTSVNGGNRNDQEHELEIEVSTAAVMDQGKKAQRGEPHEYVSLVQGFLDNVRVLSRETPQPPPEQRGGVY